MAHRQTQCDFAALRRRVQSAFVFVREEVGVELDEDVRAEVLVVGSFKLQFVGEVVSGS